ncbi:hypothetical protein EMIHUDRAFT_466683 [Emiliania huxleyi CCMP1516]|uniref:Fanconi-associated nuclease n=2 Tax=Emiliania huxleyi TaxID=2903 RepID=A0A0D3KUD8_EMIH1|nr:hypothetical protein EMIHUDRAFT_466683 [Emiliania huxleyi CCMP1516]EOD39373.1 hypothetical protein EMIHUDRAFT_466683 [Emiliania huxleyi CCMP1516]|eukprot:XP_005791802.1 hypothetical protein EMIHUDRAFT_466683 [Emiliania huxleyi CCMP1516]
MVVSGAWREADLANGSHPPATALDAARTRSLFRLIHLPKTGGTSVETLLSLGHQPHRRLSKLAWWCGALDASPSIRAAGCSSGVGRSSSPFLLPHGVGMRQLARRLRLAEAFLADNADVVGTTDQLDDVIVTLCHLAGASAAGVAAAAAAASASPAAAANGTAWARRLARGNVLPRYPRRAELAVEAPSLLASLDASNAYDARLHEAAVLLGRRNRHRVGAARYDAALRALRALRLPARSKVAAPARWYAQELAALRRQEGRHELCAAGGDRDCRGVRGSCATDSERGWRALLPRFLLHPLVTMGASLLSLGPHRSC